MAMPAAAGWTGPTGWLGTVPAKLLQADLAVDSFGFMHMFPNKEDQRLSTGLKRRHERILFRILFRICMYIYIYINIDYSHYSHDCSE